VALHPIIQSVATSNKFRKLRIDSKEGGTSSSANPEIAAVASRKTR